MNSHQCRRKEGGASVAVNSLEGRIRNLWTKKGPLYVERAESISGGDMEETGTNIHIGLVRRNNFLRENPISCQIAAVCGSHARLAGAAGRRRRAMTQQEPERS